MPPPGKVTAQKAVSMNTGQAVLEKVPEAYIEKAAAQKIAEAILGGLLSGRCKEVESPTLGNLLLRVEF